MTTLARAARWGRIPGPGPDVAVGVAAALGAALVGGAVAAGYAPYAAALLIFSIALGIGLVDWRLSALALVAYIPFSGLLILALYPQTAPGALAKDFLFVIPAYAGFFGSCAIRGRPALFAGPPWVLLGLLAILVLAHAFNPSLPSTLVGLVGLKVWLLYVPMLFIGYHLIASRADLDRFLRLFCLTAIIPAAVGIAQAALIYGGRGDLVYAMYGDAAAAATQGFAVLEIGTADLIRVPSTFSFVTQYYLFTAVAVTLAYAWWRLRSERSAGPTADAGAHPPARRSAPAAAVLVLALLAAMTSGSRGAFVFIPALLLLIVALEGRIGGRAIGLMAIAAGGIAIAAALIGAGPATLATHLWDNAIRQFDLVVLDGFGQAFEATTFGLGTGIDTNAARYVATATDQFALTGGVWQESWWVKAVLELGAPGLLLSVAVFAALLLAGLRVHRGLTDPGLRGVSAAILALLAWGLAYNLKAQYIDLDPLNVYFWLLAGILFRLPALDGGGGSDASGSASAPPRRPRRTRLR